MLVRKAREYLKSLLIETGCDKVAGINDDFGLLIDGLTGNQLATVAGMLERCLKHTHGVSHLSDSEARAAIRESNTKRDNR